MWRCLLLIAFLTESLLVGSANCDGFATYLDSLGLKRISLVEIERSCLEDCDPKSCLKYVEATGALPRRAWIDSILSTGCYSSDGEALKLIIEAGKLFYEKKYSQAETLLARAVGLLPSVDLLVEAAILNVKIKQQRFQDRLALEMLETIDQYVDRVRKPEILHLRGISELRIEPQLAVADLRKAFEGGLSHAGVDLLRAYLVEADTVSFRDMLNQLPWDDQRVVERICDLACEVDDLVPTIRDELIDWLLRSASFKMRSDSCLLKRLIEKALVDSTLDGYLLRFSEHAEDDETRKIIGVGSAISNRSIDSLFKYSSELSDWKLALKCCLLALSQINRMKDEAREVDAMIASALVDRLGKLLDHHRSEVAWFDKIKIVELLLKSGYSSHLNQICKEWLKEVFENKCEPRIEIAKLALSVDPSLAREVAQEVVSSPVSGLDGIEARRILWELQWLVSENPDMSSEIEKALGLDDDLRRGDYFSNRLKRPDKAVPYYRRALRSADGALRDSLIFWLGRCLVRLKEEDRPDLGEEAYALITRLAYSDFISAGDVLDLALAATGFLKKDRGFVLRIATLLLERNRLEATDLREILEIAYSLFLSGESDAYQVCLDASEKLIVDFRSSSEAGIAMIIDGKIKSMLGSYSSAIKRFEKASKEWPWLGDLSKQGIADCLIGLGEIDSSVNLLKSCNAHPTILYKLARCLDLVGESDSALFYYRKAYQSACDEMLLREIRIDLGRSMVSNGASLDSLGLVSHSFASYCDRRIADDIHLADLILRCLVSQRNGYSWIAESNFSRIGYLADWITCRARLMLADLVSDEDPVEAMKLLPTQGQCLDKISSFEILKSKATYACMTDSVDLCTTNCRDLLKSSFGRSMVDRLRVFRLLSMPQSEEEDWLELVDSLEPSISDSVALFHLAYFKADRMISSGDYRGAIENLLSIVRKSENPLYHRSCFRLGSAYYMEGIYDSAAYYFQIASNIDDQSLSRHALFNAGLCYESQGQADKALENFWKCATGFPLDEQFERSFIRSAFALEELGRLDDAIEVYKAVIRYSRSHDTKAEAQYWLAQCFAKSGKHQRAVVEHLRNFYLFGDEEAWAATSAFEAGMECEALGWKEEAIAIYKIIAARYDQSTDWGRSSRMRLRSLGEK